MSEFGGVVGQERGGVACGVEVRNAANGVEAGMFWFSDVNNTVAT